MKEKNWAATCCQAGAAPRQEATKQVTFEIYSPSTNKKLSLELDRSWSDDGTPNDLNELEALAAARFERGARRVWS